MAPEMQHECFRAERRDEAWATATETRVREFIARQPYGKTFDISSVECRASLCEIHASSEAPVVLSDPQGALSPATWRSLVHNMRQDAGLASEFEENGLLPQARFGERANYKATLVRRSSAVPAEPRCGGKGEEALLALALKSVTGGSPGDVAQGLPPLSEEIIGSAFKLKAYFEAEERDEAWATAMEASLQEALAGQPASRTWKDASIECRTTLCQVRASTARAAADEFREAIAAVSGESSELGLERVAHNVAKDPQDPSHVVQVATLFRAR